MQLFGCLLYEMFTLGMRSGALRRQGTRSIRTQRGCLCREDREAWERAGCRIVTSKIDLSRLLYLAAILHRVAIRRVLLLRKRFLPLLFRLTPVQVSASLIFFLALELRQCT